MPYSLGCNFSRIATNPFQRKGRSLWNAAVFCGKRRKLHARIAIDRISSNVARNKSQVGETVYEKLHRQRHQ